MNTGNTTAINSCNWNTNVAHLNVYPWQLSTGLESGWVGGPGQDADAERTGGFVMMDISQMFDRPVSGYQKRGLVITELLTSTTVAGRCAQFYYNMEVLII